jgi:predicted ATP-grasp superfamily ATP-dependent carboligase
VLRFGGVWVTAAPVIVTDGEARAALAAVRSLGAAGLPVHVVASKPSSLAGCSRFALREHVLPDPDRAPEAWAEALAGLATSLPGSLLLPVTEVALGTIYETGGLQHCHVAAPGPSEYGMAVDKHGLLERARAVGLDTPRSVLVEDPERLAELPQGFRFPVVLKARRSRWFEDGGWRYGGVRIVENEAELRAAVRDPGFAAGALLQEFVPGHGEGLFFLMEHGAPRARFAHRRLREKPPWGGVSVLCESVEPDPALARASERLLGDLGWHGVAMVEFRRAPDGRAALMEVNPRLWGSLQLAIDAGLDFPHLLASLYRGEPLPPVEPRIGVRTRWLFGDLDHLSIALRRRPVRRALGRSALGLVAQFLRSFFDGTRLEVWRRDDQGPFRAELRERLGRS